VGLDGCEVRLCGPYVSTDACTDTHSHSHQVSRLPRCIFTGNETTSILYSTGKLFPPIHTLVRTEWGWKQS